MGSNPICKNFGLLRSAQAILFAALLEEISFPSPSLPDRASPASPFNFKTRGVETRGELPFSALRAREEPDCLIGVRRHGSCLFGGGR